MGEPTDPDSREPQTAPPCEFDAGTLQLRLDETIPADFASVSAMVEKIMTAVAEIGCAQDHEFEIRLALSEALTNAVEHGCEKDPTKTVEICVECDPERGMLIVVRDPGKGFDPDSLPSPVEGERLFASRGRGVYLINRLMDEVHFRRGGTEIVMLKRGVLPRP